MDKRNLGWKGVAAATAVGFVAFVSVSALTERSLAKEGSKRVEGKLYTVIEEYPDGGRQRNVLIDGNGKQYDIESPTDLNFKSGSTVSLLVKEMSDSKIVADSTQQAAVISEPAALSLGTELDKKAIVFIVTFQGGSSDLSVSQARSVMWTGSNNVSDFYGSMSYGKWGIVGKDNPDGDIYTINLPSHDGSGCMTTAWLNAVDSIASGMGVTVSEYDNRIYYYNSLSCPWLGAATFTGKSLSIKKGNFNTSIVSHELGHNYGISHANRWECSDAPAFGTCTSIEYGDPYDVMNNIVATSPHHTNAYNKSLRWLDSTNIADVSVAGSHVLEPYQQQTLGLKSIKIRRNSTHSYYFEYRPSLGVLARVAPTTFQFTAESNIIRLGGSGYALPQGQSFTDIGAGFTVTLLGTSAAGATLDVSFFEPVCVRKAPTLATNPSIWNATQGQSVNFGLTVTNNDNSGCAPATFDFSTVAPSGVTYSIDRPSWVIAPGTVDYATLRVTNNTGSTVHLTETVTNAESGLAASVNLTVMVADLTPPVVTITNPANGTQVPAKGTVNITATATDNVGVSMISIYLDNNLMKVCPSATSCLYKWSTSKTSTGQHVIRVTASDTQNNQAEASVTVTK
jgi:hypothetical protein